MSPPFREETEMESEMESESPKKSETRNARRETALHEIRRSVRIRRQFHALLAEISRWAPRAPLARVRMRAPVASRGGTIHRA